LHLKELSTKNTVRDFERALDKLPNEINDTYRQAINRINKQAPDDRDIALKALKWTLLAVDVLSVRELRHALAIEPDEHEDDINEDALCAIEDVISACAGLLEVDQETQTVRLVHFTAREYFRKSTDPWLSSAQLHLAKACIDYICLPSMRNVQTWSPHGEFHNFHPFFYYASRNFGVHLKASITIESAYICLRYLDRVQTLPVALLAIARTLPTSAVWKFPERDLELIKFPPAHVAATLRIPEIVKLLCEQDTKASSEIDSWNNTPLHIASSLEDVRSVEELLKTHGDLDRCNQVHLNPLHCAIRVGRDVESCTAIVKLLLEAGANPNVKLEYDVLPLHRVAEDHRDLFEIATLLVDHGAEVSARGDDDGETALSKDYLEEPSPLPFSPLFSPFLFLQTN
jgi:hypothetical protein